MDLRHLKYVVAAARNGSFSAASHELAVQQPIVSRRIRELEQEFGTRLFDRSTAGARLTPIGEDFVRMAQRILDDVQNLSDRTRASVQGKLGQITLGFYKPFLANELRSSIRAFREKHRDIHIELLELPCVDLIAGLHAGRLDTAVILGDVGKCTALESMALWSEHLVVVMPATHRLADRPVIYWPELKGERFILSQYDPGPDILNILLANLAAPSDRPNVRSVNLRRESILAEVADGQGISLLCESVICSASTSLVFRPVQNGSGATRLGYIICWHPDNKNPALATFLESLRPQI